MAKQTKHRRGVSYAAHPALGLSARDNDVTNDDVWEASARRLQREETMTAHSAEEIVRAYQSDRDTRSAAGTNIASRNSYGYSEYTPKYVQSNKPRGGKLKTPVLMFSPLAWYKYMWFLDAASTEIGGFGLSRTENLFYIDEFHTVKQECTVASVDFDGADIARYDYENLQQKLGVPNTRSVWMHTHPGSSANPSGTDEDTLMELSVYDWMVMLIVSRSKEVYARLRVMKPVPHDLEIEVCVDDRAITRLFRDMVDPAQVAADWEAEFDRNIRKRTYTYAQGTGQYGYGGNWERQEGSHVYTSKPAAPPTPAQAALERYD